MIEEREFGASLRHERERRGISLDEIAEQTKVSASLLSGLERGDLSRWPAGIFRRAFVRSYATAVGMDPELTLAEFLRVFPEDGGPARPKPPSTGGHSLRLTLGEPGGAQVDWRRVIGVLIDVGVLATLVGTAYVSGGTTKAWLGAFAIAVVWHATGAMLWGMSPGLWTTNPRRQGTRPEPARAAMELASDEPEVRRGSMVGMVPRTRLARRDRRAASRPDRAVAADHRGKVS